MLVGVWGCGERGELIVGVGGREVWLLEFFFVMVEGLGWRFWGSGAICWFIVFRLSGVVFSVFVYSGIVS